MTKLRNAFPNPFRRSQTKTLRSSTSKRILKTFLAPSITVYYLPRLIPIKKKPTSLKEWC